MKNPTYRIKIEVIGTEEGEGISEKLRGGVECSGFAILAPMDERETSIVMHGVSNLDLARMIAANDELFASAHIAKALRESKDILEKGKIKSLADLLCGR